MKQRKFVVNLWLTQLICINLLHNAYLQEDMVVSAPTHGKANISRSTRVTLPRPAPGSATSTARVTAGTWPWPRGGTGAGPWWLVIGFQSLQGNRGQLGICEIGFI